MERIDSEEDEVLGAKLALASEVPGLEVEFTPEEAEMVGAFADDALSLEDARDGAIDLITPEE